MLDSKPYYELRELAAELGWSYRRTWRRFRAVGLVVKRLGMLVVSEDSLILEAPELYRRMRGYEAPKA